MPLEDQIESVKACPQMPSCCLICGTILRPFVEGDEPVGKLDWSEEVRAVRYSEVTKTSRLTGIGYVSVDWWCLFVPENPQYSYLSPNVSLKSITLRYDDTNYKTHTFIFHEACWKLLQDRVTDDPSRLDSLAAALATVLYCTPCHGRDVPQPGHDYGGAAAIQTEMREGGYMSEPSRFHNVEEILSHLSEAERAVSLDDLKEKVIYIGGQPHFDVFSRLPIEVTHCLLSCLPSQDISSLRLASKTIAIRSHVKDLPQSFWKSRFSAELEMGFALPEHISTYTNWRELYFIIKRGIKAQGGIERLRNRKRIWDIVGHNASLLSLYVQGMNLHGIEPSWDDLRSPADAVLEKELSEIINAELSDQLNEKLNVGGRRLFARCLPLRSKAHDIRAVGVSTVSFNSRKYISGLRLLTRDSKTTEGSASCSLGYVVPTTETLLDLSPEEQFLGLELATCATGIVGIRAIVEAESQRSSSTWAGDIGQGEPDIAFGSLTLNGAQGAFNIVAGLDHFKMVSLAIVQFDTPQRHLPKQRRSDLPGFVPQLLWTPSQPDKEAVIIEPDLARYQYFNAILNIDFGGSKGENLDKLTRVVAHMGGIHSPFKGLMFDFNSHTKLYGRQGTTELSFLIDGPGGERISEIACEEAPSMGIWSLEIRTNFGRHVTFVPDKLCKDYTNELSSDDRVYKNHILRAPEKHVITGLTSVLGVRRKNLRNIGLQCSYLEEGPAPEPREIGLEANDSTTSAAEVCSDLGVSLIGGGWPTECTGYTFAPLKGIKRIRFSCGHKGRSREQEELSGLLIEYENSHYPVVLGQWITEIDSMSFEKDEAIVEVSIKTSKRGLYVTNYYGSSLTKNYHGNGRVISISIVTSNKQKTVQSTDSVSPNDYLEVKFRENRHEKLSGIAWGFNAEFDHFRLRMSPPTDDSKRLQLWNTSDDMNPSWMAPDKILWREIGPDGKEDWVKGVTAYRSFIYTVKYITGLAFTYNSGAVRVIGSTDGEPCREVSMRDYCQISQIVLVHGQRGLLEVILTFEEHDMGEDRMRWDRKLVGDPLKIPDVEPVILREKMFILSRRVTISDNQWYNGQMYDDRMMPENPIIGWWGLKKEDDSMSIGIIFSDEQASVPSYRSSEFFEH